MRISSKNAQPDLSFGEIAKVLSQNFQALPEEERAYWDEQAAADKERYDKEDGCLHSQTWTEAAADVWYGPARGGWKVVDRGCTIIEQSACLHGKKPPPDGQQVDVFLYAFVGEYNAATGTIRKCFERAQKATREKYANVWNKVDDMRWIYSQCLTEGVQHVWDGNMSAAPAIACFALFFDQYSLVELFKTQAIIYWPRIVELDMVDEEHTLILFLKNCLDCIPCSCLDEKYEEVKSIPRMGICYNNKCSRPGRMADFNTMIWCKRCKQANYCSYECHSDHLPWHSRRCDKVAAVKAELESKRQPLSERQNFSVACRHGAARLPEGHTFREFFDAFTDEFCKLSADGSPVEICLSNATEATREKYVDVWNDPAVLGLIVSCCLAREERPSGLDAFTTPGGVGARVRVWIPSLRRL
jgi:hypothetical protein